MRNKFDLILLSVSAAAVIYLILMPRISFFLGISIYMYFRDHSPPHFHAMYGEFAGMVEIMSGDLIAGKLPPRVAALIKEWSETNQELLLKNWEISQTGGDFIAVPPLE